MDRAALGTRPHPHLADLAHEIVPQIFERLRDRPENNESAWTALLSGLGRVPGLTELAPKIVPLAFERLRDRAENNETAWGALLTALGRVPGLTELARVIVPLAFEWLRDRLGSTRGASSGLLIALSSPIDIDARKRADMLATLYTWYDAHVPAHSHLLRGVRLLQLADGAHPALVPAVAAELTYLESNPESKSLLTLAQPVAYAIARTGRADLETRYAVWERRAPGTTRRSRLGASQASIVSTLSCRTATAAGPRTTA